MIVKSILTKDRNIVVALEDLEDHFKQCYLNGTPAVIVLEDIDIFATREKQVLIYTLLDFMHRKDQLLVVIGTTSKAHLPTLLEKRTASRLNAQFVYVPPATGRDVCQVMSRCLTLPIEDAQGQAQGQGDRPTEESKDVDGEANGDAMDVEGAGGGHESCGEGVPLRLQQGGQAPIRGTRSRSHSHCYHHHD